MMTIARPRTCFDVYCADLGLFMQRVSALPVKVLAHAATCRRCQRAFGDLKRTESWTHPNQIDDLTMVDAILGNLDEAAQAEVDHHLEGYRCYKCGDRWSELSYGWAKIQAFYGLNK